MFFGGPQDRIAEDGGESLVLKKPRPVAHEDVHVARRHALHADGEHITTIEGIASDDQLHAVQQAFIDCGGAQCGICTPGMVLAAVNLLERNPNPTETDIRNGLAGNLCRCTGYMKIFESVVRACKNK